MFVSLCFLVSFCIFFFITSTLSIMFTNIPPSSQIYGTWNVVGTRAVDDGSGGYYQRVERQMDELAYWLEQLVRKKPIQQYSRDVILTQTHIMLGGMIISTWDMTMHPCHHLSITSYNSSRRHLCFSRTCNCSGNCINMQQSKNPMATLSEPSL